jgi:acyl CoA:acetate/3-ketoacid CoA transferase beta subunit
MYWNKGQVYPLNGREALGLVVRELVAGVTFEQLRQKTAAPLAKRNPELTTR